MAVAKVFARLFDYAGTPTMEAGTLRFTMEWKLLGGSRASGKFVFTNTDPLVSDDKLRADLRDALAAFLSQKYAPEVFRPRDIIGYSV